MRMSDCHPGRKHHARGMCRPCYMKAYGQTPKSKAYVKAYKQTPAYKATEYKRLPEREKEGDREQADAIMAIIAKEGSQI